MDDPELDPALHRHALRALERVNRVSGTAGRVWRAIQTVAGSPHRGGPVRVLDVACGGGEVLLSAGRRAARAGLAVELHGCDVSPTALDHAREAGARAGIPLHLHRLDVLADPLPDGFDLVSTSLFLHHLEWPRAVEVLGRFREVARGGVVQDLIRSPLGWALAWGGLRLLSRSRVTWVDGPRSVEAGFTLEEAEHMAREAGIPGARISRAWPERLILRWGAAA